MAISLPEAVESVLSAACSLAAEKVPVEDALDRVLAQPLTAAHDVQPFDNSAMDGFAFRHADGASLRIAGESRAGAPGPAVAPGTAARVSTGAVLPDGADTVARIEDCTVMGERLEIDPLPGLGANIRRAGEDVRAGEILCEAGTTLGAAELALCATAGVSAPACATRPRIRIVVSGDELVAPDQALGPGQIHESNGLALAALALSAGCERPPVRRCRDDPAATAEAIAWAAGEADIVIACGGISVGEHDHVRAAMADCGFEERFWRIALKPGGPAWFGVRDGRLAFGLPGNPVSAHVTFELLVRPAIDAMLGRAGGPDTVGAKLTGEVDHRPGRTEAVRVRLTATDAGWEATPTGAQGSHRLSSMLGADGLALIAPDAGPLAPGDQVSVVRLT